ncbi:MAG: PA2778 family cysteine peptidase, partial [Desulfobulbaceae bacterium]|nr:PA2778 family cysteine peptidase [Desulfobulbaceae bacterium]
MGINERAGGRIAAGLFFLLLPWLTAGCSLLATPPLPGQASGPDRVLLADVPFYSQDAHQCGPAALAMALAWSGELVVPGDLIGQVYTPSKKGSLQSDLVAAARRHGRLAYPVAGAEALFAEVAAGHPVLVFLNLGLSWYPKYHYAVVIGYDRSLARMYLHSGTREKEALSYGVFANTWARTGHWGLLVLPPGRLPAIVDEQPYVDAVIGLEKSGQWAA